MNQLEPRMVKQLLKLVRHISSLNLDAKKFGDSVRSHWGIENSLHWILDVALNEDDCRIRKDNAPQNFAVLRHIAVNLRR